MRVKRLQDIVSYVNKNAIVSFEELSKEFNVSSATIRRDLKELHEQGLIQKFYGGVKSVSEDQNLELPLNKRFVLNIDEKKRIAAQARAIICENDIIILDSSTTVIELAKQLADSSINIVVITNDANVAYILAMNSHIDLILVGGSIRHGYYTALGLFSEMMWKQLHANKLFMGVDAINPKLGALSFQIEEVRSKKLMLDCSEECIVLCDHTKFSTSAVLEICPIERIDKIITGTELEDSILANYADHDSLEIVRA